MSKCLDLSATSLPINSCCICNAFKHRPKPRNTAMAYEFQPLLRRLAMINWGVLVNLSPAEIINSRGICMISAQFYEEGGLRNLPFVANKENIFQTIQTSLAHIGPNPLD